MIDTTHIDVLSIIGGDTRLRKIAGTNGGEWAGACPLCSGKDRFRVQPFAPKGGRWFCRHCHPRWSDIINYFMWRMGVTFKIACELLDVGKWQPTAIKREKVVESIPEMPELADWLPALETWQQRLQDNGNLNEWLAQRGIFEPERYRLGFTGDDPKIAFKYRNRLTIPHFHKGKLTAIKARLFGVESKASKYISFEGSHYYLPYNADLFASPRQKIGVIETELDCIALQELLGLDCVAIPAGSYFDKDKNEWVCSSLRETHAALFWRVKQPYAIIDNDTSGAAFGKAFKWYLQRARIITPPTQYKDLGDCVLDHGNLEWINNPR